MSINISLSQQEYQSLKPKIIVFGVGGAGGNALDNMIESNLRGVEFIAANTDAQALENSQAKIKIQLGLNTTEGLGAGSYPETGKLAAEETSDEIAKHMEGAHMIFITAGMGGGTGTGAAPVIARIAKERNIMVVAIVTKPLDSEGIHKQRVAEKGIEELKKVVDTLIIVPNQNLFRVSNEQTPLKQAFKMSDNVLYYGIKGITDLITTSGLINIDFADLKTVMKKMGKAMMGTGEAEGENRAAKAVQEAISNPLLDDVSIRGAKGVIVNITGSPDITLFEFDEIARIINNEVDPEANIITGTAFDKDMGGKIRVSIFATGIDENNESKYNSSDDYEDVYDTKNTSEKYEETEEEINKIEEIQKNIKIEIPDKKENEEIQNLFSITQRREEIQKIEEKIEIPVEEDYNPEKKLLRDNNDREEIKTQRIQLLSNVFSSNDIENEKDRDFFLPKQAKKIKEKVKYEEIIKKEEKPIEKPVLKPKKESGGLFNLFAKKENTKVLKEDKNLKIIAKENENPTLTEELINVPPYLRHIKNND